MSVVAHGLPIELHIKSQYPLRERIRLIQEFQAWVSDLRDSKGRALSMGRVALIVDDMLSGSDFRVLMDGQPMTDLPLAGTLNPKTIANVLRRPLDAGVLDLHVKTLRVLDASLQLLRLSPPEYLRIRR